MKSICVFCGSSKGFDNVYAEAAHNLGKYLAEENITLIYGGGKVGLMGVLADAVMQFEGKVVGVIPDFLTSKEIAHSGITEMIVSPDMNSRKKTMEQLSDGFISLPGGLGTQDETFEMLTLLQLSVHRKPVGLLNTKGYYDHLLSFLDHMLLEGFFQKKHRDLILTNTNEKDLLKSMRDFTPPESEKWLKH